MYLERYPLTLKARKLLTPPTATTDYSSFHAEIFNTDRYLESVQVRGGKGFVERAERYGRTDQGRPLTLHSWFRQYLELIGDWRVGHVYTTGAAQVGKTLGHVLAFSDAIVHGRLDIGWAYASNTALIKYQKQQFRPVAEAWAAACEREFGIRLGAESDTKGLELYQIGKVSANFSFASTSVETSSTQGKSVIGGSGASFMAAILACDERSRWPNGVDFSGRLGFSPIPTKPIRDLGTPGGGAGIEKLMSGLDRHFYPHYQCVDPRCSAHSWRPLDPKGCLLTPSTFIDAYGRSRSGYLSDSGRPMDWWHGDDADMVGSAHFCCSECGIPLTDEQRIQQADMRCILTGERLVDFTDRLALNFDGRWRVGIHLSPLCRDNSKHLARDLVEKGLNADDPRVWQQEDLGIPSSAKASRLSDETLKLLVGAPCPDSSPWRTVAGLDFGRDGVWLWINQLYLPVDWPRMDNQTKRRKAIRKVAFGGKVHRDQVVGICDRFGVNFGLVDSEPDTTWSAWLCENAPFEMVDQVAIADDFREGQVRTGGDYYPCWKINNPKWHWDVMAQVLSPDAFDGRPAYRFPREWAKWLNVNLEESPLRHLKGPSFDPGTEKWVRPQDKIDDLFYAALFAEAAFAIHLDKGGDGGMALVDW